VYMIFSASGKNIELPIDYYTGSTSQSQKKIHEYTHALLRRKVTLRKKSGGNTILRGRH
jgi:hypothetical protein